MNSDGKHTFGFIPEKKKQDSDTNKPSTGKGGRKSSKTVEGSIQPDAEKAETDNQEQSAEKPEEKEE